MSIGTALVLYDISMKTSGLQNSAPLAKILVLTFYLNLVSRILRIAFYAALGGGRMTLKGQPTLAKEKRTQLDKREFYAPKKDVFHCPPSFDYNDFRCWNTLISLFL